MTTSINQLLDLIHAPSEKRRKALQQDLLAMTPEARGKFDEGVHRPKPCGLCGNPESAVTRVVFPGDEFMEQMGVQMSPDEVRVVFVGVCAACLNRSDLDDRIKQLIIEGSEQRPDVGTFQTYGKLLPRSRSDSS